MDNKEIEALLNRIGADIDTATYGAETLYCECPVEMQEAAANLCDNLRACCRRLEKLYDLVPLGAEVEEAKQAALKGAIALLEANGFIVGTKT